jgi:putative membrane protein
MDFLYIKSLHIIFVVTWFAGLFYSVRLFVYFAETADRPENEKSVLRTQYKIMQKRLWYGITWPSAILTYVFGFWMVYLNPVFLSQPWFLLKLSFVFALSLYHILCGAILNQQKKDIIKYSSFKLRILNEVATIILVSVIFIVELQNTLSWLWGLLGLIIFSVLLLIAIRIYKKIRSSKNNS